MIWSDLLFAHWALEPAALRRLIPTAFELDTYEDRAWLGIVPFGMRGVRPRGLPAIPRFVPAPNPSRFLELNVRTYVRYQGKPGVLFFSLDAASPLAVWGARRFFHLPYFHARMASISDADGWLCYRSARTDPAAAPASLSMRYRPARGSSPAPGQPGTLANWLTERYCLYTQDPRGRVLCGEIHHLPWPLQEAECEIQDLNMTSALGIDLSGPPATLYFARRLDVVAWWNQRV